MTQALKMLQRGGTESTAYVDDVFSTFLYTGNGSTQTITNGIDLSTKGGLVWIKARSAAENNQFVDTQRGYDKYLVSNNTDAQDTVTTRVTSFSTSGFALGSHSIVNGNGTAFTSWTFRKAPKFFDVVTYTGTGSNRTISHSLGQAPGMIIVKATSTTGDWTVYHRGLTSAAYRVFLNYTNAEASQANIWNSTAPTDTVFSVGTGDTNTNGVSYVAYLFAHDTATDGIIQCGTFAGTGGTHTSVTLGWEPQWLLIKQATTGESWNIMDTQRGINVDETTKIPLLKAESSAAEAVSTMAEVTATGFKAYADLASTSTIYVAIRRPNKPPTSGTQVFQPTVYTGTNVDNRHLDTTIAPDMVWLRKRNGTAFGGMLVGDRLRGQPYLATGTTVAEVTAADALDKQLVSATEYGTAFSSMSGIYIGNNATSDINLNTTASNHVVDAFKRYPGVFDVVCYTGTGSATTVSHNLGVVPELMVVKNRSTDNWVVYAAALGNTNAVRLNSTIAAYDVTGDLWNNTTPTTNVFSVGSGSEVNASANTYVSYLFATKAGISKVGSYTGNGTSQTINCGFSAGARFVLIKRTDSTGDWFVFDTARGIVAGNDPFVRLNSTAAETTTVDALDPDNSGFIVNQDATYNLNVTSATYIYLAYA